MTFDRIFNALISSLLASAVLLTTVAAAATKPPNLIRDHLLNDSDASVTSVNSVEPFRNEALDGLLTARIWKVSFSTGNNDGENMGFMAVKDGEVLRILRFDQPQPRDNLVKLLPEDFRVTSQADAEKLVAAARALHFEFPFSEPEKTVDEMHFVKHEGDFIFVDGERFGDATGYRIATDSEGRVAEFEYSWELPVDPPEDD